MRYSLITVLKGGSWLGGLARGPWVNAHPYISYAENGHLTSSVRYTLEIL